MFDVPSYIQLIQINISFKNIQIEIFHILWLLYPVNIIVLCTNTLFKYFHTLYVHISSIIMYVE